MEKVYIPHLFRHEQHTLKIPVDGMILDLETLTPVRGEILVKHQGTFLNVSAQAESIINLSCHRCLQQYNQRLQVDTSEVIWLDEAADETYDGPIELRVDFNDLVESLTPDGHFDAETWLYEQLCLALPHRQLCNTDCPGLLPKEAEPVVEVAEVSTIDGRWGSLKSLLEKSE
jgi:uncharacterized protein